MTTIARAMMYAQRPGEERFQLTVEIGTPYRKNGPSEVWACPVSLYPLYEKLSGICGEDSFQALCLAIRLVHSLLDGFLEKGGVLTYEDDTPFPLDAYGIAPMTPTKPPK